MVAGLKVGDTVRFDATAGGMTLADWEMEPGDGFGKFIKHCNGLLGEVIEIDPDDPDYVSVHFQDGELLDDVHIDHLIPVTGVRILSPRLAA